DNLVAAEVHQTSVSDSDLRFDLELLGSTDPTTNNLPNTTITSPANNAFLLQPPSINIQANATDIDGTILKVEFYRNGAKLGEDTNAPYSFLWLNPPIGTHMLTARATDNLAGRTISSPVNITVGVSAPPVIGSVIPPAGNVSNLTQITVNFSEPVTGVQASDLLISGRPATTLVAGTTNFTFGFPAPKDGTVLVAFSGAHGIEDFEPNPRAFDNFAPNASWQYNLTDRVPPTVARLSPAAGATVQSIDQVSVTFSEPVWGLDAADLLINGAPASDVNGSGMGPYKFSFNAISNGTVQLSWAAGHGIKDFASTPNNFAGGSWSYTTDPSASFDGRIVINEIMYHPQSERTTEEYIELRNAGSGSVNLAGWRLNRGLDYTFPNVSIAAGGYLVVAANLAAFTARYGNVGTVVGPWQGSLNNGSDEIELEDALGNQVDLVHYADEGDWSVRRRFSGTGWEWYSEHDGLGKSLELVNMRLDNSVGQNWAASLTLHGTPGALNSVATNNAPPLISDVEHSPAIPKSTDAVVIKARVIDESTSGLTVTLRYRDVTAGSFANAPMFDDGNHNDGGTGDGIYAATVPALAASTIVEFYIEATDATGHRRNWPRQIGDGGAEPNAFYQVDDENYTGTRPIYRLIMRPQDRADFFNFQDRVPRNATLVAVEGSDVQIRYGCSVRRRGASSFTATPPTFKLDIPRDHLWNGRSGVNMNSVSTWAQVLGSAIALKSGLAVAHARGVQFRFNGQNMSSANSQMYGMYAAVEVLNNEWAGDFFPDDGQGNVYSKRRPECGLEYRGTDPLPYINCAYDKESNASENHWSDLVKLLAALDPDTTSDTDYVSAVRRNANVEMWMRYFAVCHLMHYNETALVTGVDDDYSMYRGIIDPRFLILPHDFDSIYGSEGVNTFTIYQPAAIPNVSRFLRHPQFEPIYHDEFRRQLAGVFATNELFQLMDQVLSDWAPGELQNMKNIALARRDSVISQLSPALTVPRATLSGEPPSPTYLDGAALRVSGADIASYRYRLNNGVFGAETAVGTPITLSGLASGTYTVSVIGKNSAGAWQSTNAPTISKTWTVIPGLAGVVINEVLARNDSAVNYSNTFPDLIELYNARGTSIDLSGMRLSDDPKDPNKFTFPANTTLAAGAYLRLFADDPNGTPGIHLGFSLDQDGEGVYLFDRATNGGGVIDSVEFGNQLPNLSIGRLPSGNWGLCTPTFGSANVAASTGNPTTLSINEWLASGTFPFVDDFIEIYNSDPLPIDLGGYYLTDHPYGQPGRHRVRSLHFIPGFSYQAFLADGNPENGALHLDFHLASEGGEIGLFARDLTLIDCIYYAQQRTGVSQGRSPNGSEQIVFLDQPTPGAGNPAPNRPTGGLVINEVLANNVSQIGADSTEPDWIELYNPTNTIVDLSGMSLSDRLSNPTRWLFPANSRIPAFGYFRVNFDANSSTNATNTGFGLKATGDAVYLFNRTSAGGALLDSVTFGIQAPDFSLARVPNGGTNWLLGNPTLLAPNIAATLGSPSRLK
ncbi:MAG TPA: lamin tail domain-containing protein, partial [Candidatus Binatia bacterium]|nr:lamin tail domain-containing protein [Candidatus Binatia bacterium]